MTVQPTQSGNNWFKIEQGAEVSLTACNCNWIHDAGATAIVSVASPNAPNMLLSTVAISGGMADLYTDPAAGISVTTGGSSPVSIVAIGPVSIQSNGADNVHLGAGAANVVISGNGAEIWAGSGAATVSSSDWMVGDAAVVHGGSGAISVTGCAGLMKFIGGNGSASVLGTYGSLDVTGGSGDTTVGWSTQYGGPTHFVGGSGHAAVHLGSQGGYIQFGTGDTMVDGSDWAHATTYAFLAGQSGTDTINDFVVGWDRIQLGDGVSVISQDIVNGSAHVAFSSGAHAVFAGVADTHGLFG